MLQFTSLHMAIFLLTQKTGDAKIPEADEIYYYRNACQETLDVNSVMFTECFQVPTLKRLSSLEFIAEKV